MNRGTFTKLLAVTLCVAFPSLGLAAASLSPKPIASAGQEVKVHGLIMDPVAQVPVVLLADLAESKAMPIWIGLFEANAIAQEMNQEKAARPMTHDLIHNVLRSLKAKVIQINITDLRNDTFYATILLSINNTQVAIDSRPSDAIALALKAKASIFVSKPVMDAAQTLDLTGNKQIDQRRWREWLEQQRTKRPRQYEM